MLQFGPLQKFCCCGSKLSTDLSTMTTQEFKPHKFGFVEKTRNLWVTTLLVYPPQSATKICHVTM